MMNDPTSLLRDRSRVARSLGRRASPGLALVLAFVGALASPAAHAGRFYLSTDRVFAPGQAPVVKVEANGVDALDVRLYRLSAPRAWFDAQPDLHRPATESATPRPSTMSLLRRGAAHGLEGLLAEVRTKFDDDGRAVLRSITPDVHAVATAGPTVVPPETVLPILKDHALVHAWRASLPARYGWVYDELPIPVSTPGAYLVEAVAEGAVAYTVVLVSDVALVTKQSSTQLLVWAVDPATGAPRPGTKVTVLEQGAPLGERGTDSDGLARFDVGLRNTPVIYAENGASFTLLDPRFYSANLPEPRVYLFTERPVYRPGQEVFFKAFTREIVDEEYVLPKGGEGPVAIQVLDPEGNEVSALEVTRSARGSFEGVFTLPEEPPMGAWQVVATVDGKRYAGQFKVMSYVKPEVRLTVRLDDKVARAGDGVAGEVEGAYFFGAPYPGAEVKITISRTRFYVPWYVDTDYAWYYAEAEYQNTRREVLAESTCVLDANGRCPIELTTKADSVDYTYVVEAVALDPSGRTVTGQATLTVTPGAFRLSFDQGSVVVRPGRTETVTVVAEDYAGRPHSGAAVTVTVRARHLGQDGVLETVEVSREKKVADADGRVAVPVKLSRGGYYEVAAESVDDKGHAIVADTFLFASEDGRDLPFAPPDLEIVVDKKTYFAGDRALVLVLTPNPDAHVLFAVEGGDLYRADVIAARGHALLTTVEIGAKQTPNFFLSATTVSGGRVYTRQRSVVVPPRERLLSVEVSPDRTEAQPGEKVTFTVSASDAAGKPVADAEVALAVVDEAIYAISPEIAVPLEGFFHHRKRNDVRTEESVSFRFFGTSRALDGKAAKGGAPRTFAFGSMKPQLDDARKVFKDTAAFFPTLVTDGKGRAVAEVTLPDNLTSWRATARVVSPKTAVGMATAQVRARKPLMVTVALPARVVEGDRGEGALVVKNLSGDALDVEIGLETSGEGASLVVARPAGAAFPDRVTVKDGVTTRIPISFEAKGAGPVRVAARAKGGAHADALESTIVVEEWASPTRVSAAGRLAGDTRTVTHELALPDGVDVAKVALEVELLPSSLAALKRALPYLIGFPYGCTEQTMSRFLPVLAVAAAAKRMGLDAGPATKDLPRMISAGRDRLYQLQHDDGGWGWWEEDASDPFMTAWVVEGLVEAKRQGATIDDARLARGVEALLRQLSSTKSAIADETRAFMLLALARAGKPQAALVEALAGRATSGPVATIALVALAAHHGGAAETATVLAAQLAARVTSTARGSLFTDVDVEAAGWDGRVTRIAQHPLETTAWSLLALERIGGHAAVVDDVTGWVLGQLEGGHFGSTRQTALVVRALAESARVAVEGASKVTVQIGDKVIVDEALDAAGDGLARSLALPSPGRAAAVTITRAGGPVSYAVALKAPRRATTIPKGGTSGLSIQRTLYRLDGAQGSWRRGAAVTTARPGDALLVELEVNAAREVPYVMIEDPRPAGLQAIERDGTLVVDGVDLRIGQGHREHRDDRTAFFFTRLPPGRSRFFYLARAGLPGTFGGLPARVESMYLPATFHASSSSSSLTIGDDR